MNNVEVKRAGVKDVDALKRISEKTFYETFSQFNTEENMHDYVLKNMNANKLINELENEYSEFYFATIDSEIAGYIKLNYAQSQTYLNDDNSLEIERVYVLKEFHGKKIGRLLLNKAFEKAIQKNLKYVWLGVWEENANAINFYKKNRFAVFDKHIFKLGDDEQTDLLMKIDLQN